MLFQFVIAVSVLSFALVWIFDGFKGHFHHLDKRILEVSYFERLNKEKYLEEVGFNVMNDPW